MHQISIILQDDGERLPLLTDADGFPIIEPNCFILTQRGKAWRTLASKLQSIAILYQWAEKNRIDIDYRISCGVYFSESEINGHLLSALRKSYRKSQVIPLYVSPKVFNTRILCILEYLSWKFSVAIMRIAISDDRINQIRERQQIILSWLRNAKLSQTAAENKVSLGLSTHQKKLLLNMINTRSPSNPFHFEAIKQRNYIIVLLLLSFGLRPAELLTLRISNIQSGPIPSIVVIRRPHDPDDPRKFNPEVKRSGRILPIIDIKLARAIDNYIVEYRPTLEEKNEEGSDFLILSEDGLPLSLSSITKIFKKIKEQNNALPRNFSPKTLRHTFSTELEKAMRDSGISEARREGILMHLRGDTSPKSQRIYIEAAIREEAALFIGKHQEEIFTKPNTGGDINLENQP